jgi:hypothetical protein
MDSVQHFAKLRDALSDLENRAAALRADFLRPILLDQPPQQSNSTIVRPKAPPVDLLRYRC